MKILRFLAVLLSVCTLMGLGLILASCSRATWHAPLATTTDTLPLLPASLQAKKITITGPVNFNYQLGTGNVATPTVIDNTKAGQRATSAAIGAGSQAHAVTTSTLWYVYALLVMLLVAAGFWTHAQFPTLFSFIK